MGNPACDLASTCLNCGRVISGDRRRPCEHCGKSPDGEDASPRSDPDR
jgi:hypothetical protein